MPGHMSWIDVLFLVAVAAGPTPGVFGTHLSEVSTESTEPQPAQTPQGGAMHSHRVEDDLCV